MYPKSHYAHEATQTGRFFLITSTHEHGPFATYSDAVNAAEHPSAPLHGLDPRRGYCVVDHQEQEDA
ncbi:MAG: hypothetical protein ABNH53_02025 [Henriciella sp.]|jgi:hypothetical protein